VVAAGSDPSILVSPASNTVILGNSFQISINVTAVTNFYGYDINFTYDDTVLNCTSVSVGTLFSSASGGYLTFVNVVNNTAGWIHYVATLADGDLPITGSGNILNINFNSTGIGTSALTLQSVTLEDNATNVISCTITNGSVTVKGPSVVTLSVTAPAAHIGIFFVLISFGVSVANGTISKEWYNCMNGSSWVYATNQTYSGAVNATGFQCGSYTFYAWANATDGNIGQVTANFSVLWGDINQDGHVTLADAVLLSLAYGSTCTSSNWNCLADINCDGTVNLSDAILLAQNYGT
jgi:hypothetical protein